MIALLTSPTVACSNSLADNLNLAGTARHNLTIRQKRSWVSTTKNTNENFVSEVSQRKKIPAGWEKVVPHFNHSELWHVNTMAKDVGCDLPFPKAEVLPDDNGERFFSEHMTITMPSLKGIKHGEFGQCLCALCSRNTTKTIVFTTTASSPPRTIATTTTPMEMDETTQRTTTSPSENNVNYDVARQQASRPHQPVWNLANTLNANTMTMHLGGAIAPMVQMMPMQYQLPFCYQPQLVPCCNKCAQWLTMRKGRPSHHPLCQRR